MADLNTVHGSQTVSLKTVNYNKNTAAAADAVAALTNFKIRVLGFMFQSAAATETVQFLSAANVLSHAMSVPIPSATQLMLIAPPTEVGYFETNVGEALRTQHGSTNVVTGTITFAYIKATT